MSESSDSEPSLRALVSSVLASLRAEDVPSAAAQVCHACVSLLPVDGASLSVMLGTGHRESLYATDAVMQHVEAVQYSLGEGPCYEAFHSGYPVLVPDLERDGGGSWPLFAAEMPAGTIGAIFALPLRRGAARFGAIDMYRREPGWLSNAELEVALRISDIATSALLAASAGGPGRDTTESWIVDFTRARAVVHQATGIVVAHYAIPAVQALARLRGYSFASGRLLDDVAADLVARRLHPAVVTE